jgi:hypothetical protein
MRNFWNVVNKKNYTLGKDLATLLYCKVKAIREETPSVTRAGRDLRSSQKEIHEINTLKLKVQL